MKPKKKKKREEPSPPVLRPSRSRPLPLPTGRHYLLCDTDCERIDDLIGALKLAIGEVLWCRQIRERPQEEMPAGEAFDSQVMLTLKEADRQLQFPWSCNDTF